MRKDKKDEDDELLDLGTNTASEEGAGPAHRG